VTTIDPVSTTATLNPGKDVQYQARPSSGLVTGPAQRSNPALFTLAGEYG
jgi:hypothetical protein